MVILILKKKNRSVCIHCKESVAGKNPTNLVNHLKKNGLHAKAKHHEEYLLLKKSYEAKEEKAAVKRKRDDEVIEVSTPSGKQPKIYEVIYIAHTI